ncbi:(2Fe-2S)-binding protein [Streptomyces pactum]|uniref:(2Fe-2S)-binding protein n=1 Tax=Streptomyces pactum TaxID=68249 RepID=A0ABS0NEK9_9ACTN|nr:(2Fe-2S)-binding protein [Streptomyces pactum]MBH5333587.1 (2Fe-2S)-binding protein [Streptomyces pactum]
MTVDAALGAAGAVGPFFAVRTGPPGPGGPRAEGYVPLAEAYGPPALPGPRREGEERAPAAVRSGPAAATPPAGPPAVLVRRIDAVRAGTGAGERRVAASLAFQGLAARLWSVALGPAALTGQVPGLPPDAVWWNPDRTAPDDLWLPEPAVPAGGAGDAARRLRGAVLHGHLLPLHRATCLAARVSGALLWGNAASALAGSLRVLHGWCLAEGRPEAAERARTAVTALLGEPPLRAAGHWRQGPERDFRRRSCCLYYRVPGGGLCGDCALRRPPRRPA